MHKRVLQHLRRASRSFRSGSLEKSDGPRWTSSRSPHLVTAIAALGVSGAGCSLLYDLSGEQCATSADCAIFGSGYECNASQICEAPSIGGGNGGNAGDGGSAGDGGTEQGGSSGSGGDGGTSDVGGSAGQGGGPMLECTTNAECIEDHAGAPWLCRNNSCIELTSDECPFVIGEENLATSNNPIIFGAYTFIDPGAPRNSPVTSNFELAINEFTGSAPGGGLNSANGRRKMVAVACDGIAESTFETSLTHLIDTVGVPAIIAPVSPAQLLTMFEGPANTGSGVFFMGALDADSSLTTLEDSGLVWNILGSAANVAPAFVPLLTRAESFVKAQQSISTIRVALISDETDTMQDMSGVITNPSTGITFNGLSIAANGTDYEGFTIPSNPDAEGATTAYIDVIDDLNDFQPHVIISVTGAAFIDSVMRPLENLWNVGEQARPFYLMSPYHAGFPPLTTLVTDLNTLPAAERLYTRIMGINFESAEDLTIAEAYHTRFSQAYSGPVNLENFYDAAWYLMYSFAAAGEVGTYTGQDIRRGMDHLVRMDAPALFQFAVGGVAESNSDVALVLAGIDQAGDNGIQLIGTMGPPDFDRGTGARKTKGSAYCLSLGGAFFFDVLRYNSTGPALEGDQGTCIPFGF
jgi:hypothetical protein